MKILILGIDGYIGYPLACHLRKRGHDVSGIDNYWRRGVEESLAPLDERVEEFDTASQNIRDLENLPLCDVVVHLAQQPSAPWSMQTRGNAIATQEHNTIGTLNLLWLIREQYPDVHLVKLGSMGEYGTPGIPIPEGFFKGGKYDGLMFPRRPGSFYHLSKVFDSMNIEFACRTWGLRATDVMQGIVFGHLPGTRFDYDECFGTVINRFCVQAVCGYPLTVYGAGGQTRGFLPLTDSLECLTLAIENPPEEGEYRVFNQFAEVHSVIEIAERVRAATGCDIERVENPRAEAEKHTYEPVCDKLKNLGYKPEWDFKEEIEKLIDRVAAWKKRVRKERIFNGIKWR